MGKLSLTLYLQGSSILGIYTWAGSHNDSSVPPAGAEEAVRGQVILAIPFADDVSPRGCLIHRRFEFRMSVDVCLSLPQGTPLIDR